jgi:hypothetical protein
MAAYDVIGSRNAWVTDNIAYIYSSWPDYELILLGKFILVKVIGFGFQKITYLCLIFAILWIFSVFLDSLPYTNELVWIVWRVIFKNKVFISSIYKISNIITWIARCFSTFTSFCILIFQDMRILELLFLKSFGLLGSRIYNLWFVTFAEFTGLIFKELLLLL